MPFRDAYKQVGLAIEAGNFTYTTQMKHTHEGSLGNLCTSQIAATMQKVVASMEIVKVEQQIKQLLKL